MFNLGYTGVGGNEERAKGLVFRLEFLFVFGEAVSPSGGSVLWAWLRVSPSTILRVDSSISVMAQVVDMVASPKLVSAKLCWTPTPTATAVEGARAVAVLVGLAACRRVRSHPFQLLYHLASCILQLKQLVFLLKLFFVKQCPHLEVLFCGPG